MFLAAFDEQRTSMSFAHKPQPFDLHADETRPGQDELRRTLSSRGRPRNRGRRERSLHAHAPHGHHFDQHERVARRLLRLPELQQRVGPAVPQQVVLRGKGERRSVQPDLSRIGKRRQGENCHSVKYNLDAAIPWDENQRHDPTPLAGGGARSPQTRRPPLPPPGGPCP